LIKGDLREYKEANQEDFFEFDTKKRKYNYITEGSNGYRVTQTAPIERPISCNGSELEDE
jgi:hypothetical protein